MREGQERGLQLARSVFVRHKAGKAAEEIAAECGITLEQVRELLG